MRLGRQHYLFHPGFAKGHFNQFLKLIKLFVSGGKCIDQLNGYYCLWEDEIGLSFETKIKNPCTLENLVQGEQFYELVSPHANTYLECTDFERFVLRKCASIMFWHQDLKICSIEPLKTNVCHTVSGTNLNCNSTEAKIVNMAGRFSNAVGGMMKAVDLAERIQNSNLLKQARIGTVRSDRLDDDEDEELLGNKPRSNQFGSGLEGTEQSSFGLDPRSDHIGSGIDQVIDRFGKDPRRDRTESGIDQSIDRFGTDPRIDRLESGLGRLRDLFRLNLRSNQAGSGIGQSNSRFGSSPRSSRAGSGILPIARSDSLNDEDIIESLGDRALANSGVELEERLFGRGSRTSQVDSGLDRTRTQFGIASRSNRIGSGINQ